MKCELMAECKLPVKFSRACEVDMKSFSYNGRPEEVIALIHKKSEIAVNEVPLVRVHSACITGEIFGSQKCDCGYQFKQGMGKICSTAYGIMLYMTSHEGRGIGLNNKIRAYQLQEQGANTIEANEKLGFPADARDFSAAVAVLKFLKVDRVKILTNNPEKIKVLRNNNIEVVEQVSLSAELNQFNKQYLLLKQNVLAHRFQHFLQETSVF